MREDLLKFIPEFNLIKDLNLKEKVLKVWENALTTGDWEIKDLQWYLWKRDLSSNH